MRIKVNDTWYSVESILYNDNTDFVGRVAPKEVEDIEFDTEGECTYKELQRMCADYACPESDVQEAMNDYDAAIAPLADRISQIEEILRGILLSLDFYKNDKKMLVSREVECLQERMNTLEHKPQSTVQEPPICELEKRIIALEDGLTTHVIGSYEHMKDSYINRVSEHQTMIPDSAIYVKPQIDWEQRRYEIAKEIFVKYALKSSSDTLEQRVVAAADKLINKLKKQEE